MSVALISHVFEALEHRATNCDRCGERPGKRTIIVCGTDTLVCDHCSGISEPEYPCYACGEESTHEIIHRGAPLDVCDRCDLEQQS
jgi:hypothetical protein